MRVTLFGGRLAQAGTGPATTIAATKYQSFRLTCGAGRIYRTEHKQGTLSAARARYFVFAQRIFHTPQAYFIAPQAPPPCSKKRASGVPMLLSFVYFVVWGWMFSAARPKRADSLKT